MSAASKPAKAGFIAFLMESGPVIFGSSSWKNQAASDVARINGKSRMVILSVREATIKELQRTTSA